MDAQAIYYAIAVLLVVIGLLGIVLPALPGVPLMFAGMLLAAWTGDFQHIGFTALAILGVLTALSLLADFWATAIGAKRVGAGRTAIIGAVAGTFVGMFFGLPGLFVGPFVGALVGELLSRRGVGPGDLGQAARVGFGTWLGIALGIALKLMLAFAMIAVFATAWFT